jgi:methionine synthase II (cobalamin-independent)
MASRTTFYEGFLESLEGMTRIDNAGVEQFRLYDRSVKGHLKVGFPIDTVICQGKVRHSGKSYYLPGFESLKSTVPEQQWKLLKLSMVAPAWYHPRQKQGRVYPESVYNNDKEYFADVAEAYATEIKLLYDNGLRNLQFDDPNFICQYWFLNVT